MVLSDGARPGGGGAGLDGLEQALEVGEVASSGAALVGPHADRPVEPAPGRHVGDRQVSPTMKARPPDDRRAPCSGARPRADNG